MSADCLFCKIVEGEIPATKVFENDNVIGFVDIHPQAKTHLLFVHKTHTSDINELSQDPKSLGEVFQAISEHTKAEGLDKNGLRVVTNLGKHGGQTVFHTHFHVLAGEQLGRFGS